MSLTGGTLGVAKPGTTTQLLTTQADSGPIGGVEEGEIREDDTAAGGGGTDDQ